MHPCISSLTQNHSPISCLLLKITWEDYLQCNLNTLIYNPTTKCSCINLLLNNATKFKFFPKILVPSPTLKMNIALNVHNEHIRSRNLPGRAGYPSPPSMSSSSSSSLSVLLVSLPSVSSSSSSSSSSCSASACCCCGAGWCGGWKEGKTGSGSVIWR